MPGTIPYPETNKMSPESMIGDYLQRDLQNAQDAYNIQYDEVSKRQNIGVRAQNDLIDQLSTSVRGKGLQLRQAAKARMDELALVDQLAEQGGFDPYEAKMRIVLGPEAEAAMFPRQGAQPSQMDTYRDLDLQEKRLTDDKSEFLMGSGGRVPHWYNFAVLGRYEEQEKDKLYKRIYGPSQKEVWQFGKKGQEKDYVLASKGDRLQLTNIQRKLGDIRQQKQELLSTPDIAKRVRSAMLGVKRDSKTDSFATRVQGSVPQPKTRQAPIRRDPPTQEALLQASKGMKKGSKERQELFNLGVQLGYWE